MVRHSLVAFVSQFLMDRLRPGWRERKERRRSPWHLLKLLIMFPLMGGAGYLLFHLVWLIHNVVYPEHAGRLGAFLAEHEDTAVIVSRGLMIFPLFLPSLGIGMLTTNLLLWCIPLARRAFEAEAIIPPEPEGDDDVSDWDFESAGESPESETGRSGAGPAPVLNREMTFRDGSLKLLRITLKYLIPIGCGLALIGAMMPFDLE